MPILSLMLYGSILLAQADPQLPPAPAAVHLIVARNDGSHVSALFPPSGKDLRGAEAIWAWTSDTPALKLDVRAVPSGREVLLETLKRSPSRIVRIRVRGWSTPEERAGIRVVAAPAEMWGTVPEAMLPWLPLSEAGWVDVPVHGAVRARAVGEGVGTAWETADASARTMDLVLRRPTADVRLSVRTTDGKVVERAFGSVMRVRSGDVTPALEAQVASGEDGVLSIPALPVSEAITVLVSSRNLAPTAISGGSRELTRTILLPPAGEVLGRFVDRKGAVLGGVDVLAEAWTSAQLPTLVRRQTKSEREGGWRIGGLPRTSVVIRAEADGLATFSARVSVEDGVADLGDVRLAPAADLALTVADASGAPIPDVSVRSDRGFDGRTDEAGLLTVTGLAADEPSLLTLTARGFERKSLRMEPPFGARHRVLLDAVGMIQGKVVREDGGAPASGATGMVTTGNALRRFDLASDGSFELEVAPGEELNLTFESPRDGSAMRKVVALAPGEVRKLGSIRLDAGLSVTGRVVDSAGMPVAAARVWTLRSNVEGALAAWVQGRVIEGRSDAEGRFELKGLAPGSTILRVDASDLARAHRTFSAEADPPVDIGDIELARGITVSVSADREDATLASIDLLGRGVEADMLSAPVLDGTAVLRHVPSGAFRVRVMAGRSVICERSLAADSQEVTLVCPPAPTVRGQVVLDGTSAAGGSLAWSREERCDSLVTSSTSPLGSVHQRTYGGCGAAAATPVRQDGTFESKELMAGDWRVAWHAEGGAATPRIQVRIPDLPDVALVLRFAGGVVRGRVVDRDGWPVPLARVREVQGPLFAFTALDGAFTLAAVAPGVHRLQASLGSQTSRVVEVALSEDSRPPEVLLELDDEQRDDTTIQVVDATGAPGAGAFVFIQTASGVRVLTADAEGMVRTSFPERLAEPANAVAFLRNEWSVGAIQRIPGRGDERAGIVRFGPTGSLRIESRTTSGAPRVLSASTGDLTWMLARLGTPLALSPETPLVLHGLVPGVYDVRLGEAVASVSVSPRSTTTAHLP